MPLTPEEQKAKKRAYYLKHRETWRHKYYFARHEQKLEYGRAHHAANKEKANHGRKERYLARHEQELKYRRDRRDIRNMQRREWYQKNREAELAKSKEYARSHPEQINHYIKARIARKRGAPINDLTVQQWREIKAHYGYRCVYCDKKFDRLTMDHHGLPFWKPLTSDMGRKERLGRQANVFQTSNVLWYFKELSCILLLSTGTLSESNGYRSLTQFCWLPTGTPCRRKRL